MSDVISGFCNVNNRLSIAQWCWTSEMFVFRLFWISFTWNWIRDQNIAKFCIAFNLIEYAFKSSDNAKRGYLLFFTVNIAKISTDGRDSRPLDSPFLFQNSVIQKLFKSKKEKHKLFDCLISKNIYFLKPYRSNLIFFLNFIHTFFFHKEKES